MESIKCQICNKVFEVYPSWIGKRKTCSKDCAKKLASHKTGVKNPMYGKKHTKDTKLKMAKAKLGLLGENSNCWLGNKAGYSAIHVWVRKMLGEPDTCQDCGKSGLHGPKIHWANLSGEYKRDLSDWIRLCTFCHRKHDKNRVTAKNIFQFKLGGYAERRTNLGI